MKKNYMKPEMEVVQLGAISILTVSGNFTEAETINADVYPDEISGDNAW